MLRKLDCFAIARNDGRYVFASVSEAIQPFAYVYFLLASRLDLMILTKALKTQ